MQNSIVKCFILKHIKMNEIVNKFSLAGTQQHFALHLTSYLSITLSKILLHSKTIKNTKKFSVFGENDSCRLSNFLQMHIFWNFDHISRIYNQVNCRNIWFEKVIILIMTAQVLFYMFFPKKTHTLMLLSDKLMPEMHLKQPDLLIVLVVYSLKTKKELKIFCRQEIQTLIIEVSLIKLAFNMIWLMVNQKI